MPYRLQTPTHYSPQLPLCLHPPQGSGPAVWAHSPSGCPWSPPLCSQVMGMLGTMACLQMAQGCWGAWLPCSMRGCWGCSASPCNLYGCWRVFAHTHPQDFGGPQGEFLHLWSTRILGVTCCPQGHVDAAGDQLPPCPCRCSRHIPALITHLQLALQSVRMLGVFTHPRSPGAG